MGSSDVGCSPDPQERPDAEDTQSRTAFATGVGQLPGGDSCCFRRIGHRRNALLAAQGRLTLVRRIDQGRPVALFADEVGVSRTTADRQWSRFQAEGEAGLHDRPA
jgi:hypothetical protein